jgi:hypothetical protein
MLAALGMIWAAFLLPSERRKASKRSVEDFERNMELLAETDGHQQGRWIITPRKGVAFVGPRERAHQRARERRRKVLAFFLETIGLSFLIGIVPPLHVVWWATAALVALLAIYVWMLLSVRERSRRARASGPVHQATAPKLARPVRQRYVSESASRTARPSFNGLVAHGVDDIANIVVRPAREVGARV